MLDKDLVWDKEVCGWGPCPPIHSFSHGADQKSICSHTSEKVSLVLSRKGTLIFFPLARYDEALCVHG